MNTIKLRYTDLEQAQDALERIRDVVITNKDSAHLANGGIEIHTQDLVRVATDLVADGFDV